MILKYEPFEITLTTANSYSNPYLDVWLNATFIGPNNTKINIDGFWNGVNTWKIRMAPTETGTWSYTTNSNDAQLNGKTGSFNVIDSGKNGFIKVNPNYPYSFMYDDGTPFFWMGDTLWDDPGITRFKEYIDLINSYRYNNYHTIIIHDRYEYQSNEAGTPFEMISSKQRNYDKLRPGFFQALDERVRYANSKGIAAQMYFTWAQEFIKFNRQQFERFVKYMVARYSAYNVVWIVSGEYNEAGTPSEYAYHGNVVYNKDPYKHPISIHPSGDPTHFVNDAWLTYIMKQEGYPNINIAYSGIINYRKYNKPVINGEAFYLVDGYITVDNWRKQNWLIVIAGGFLDTGYQNIVYDPEGVYGDPLSRGWNLSTPNNLLGMAQMKYLSNFFNTISFWNMNPNNSVTSNGYALANPDKEYVIYLPTGGSTNVNLSSASGTLSVEWYNPREGTYHGKTTVQGGAPRTFTSPDSNDWILHIFLCSPSVCDFAITQ